MSQNNNSTLSLEDICKVKESLWGITKFIISKDENNP
jgi:hypothetical protein